MLKGPDLSKWQGIVDFEKLKKDVDFVILRSTYGLRSMDSKFLEYAAECKRVGIPILGVYHFCYAKSNKEAEQEAENCISAVEKACLNKKTIIFYDLEYDSVDTARRAGVFIGNNEINSFTTAFCHKVKQAGYRTGIYYNKDYYRTKYKKEVVECYIRWLADYKNPPSYDCDIQQYSASFRLKGIDGNVDMNVLWNDELLMREEDSGMTKQEIVDLVKSTIEEEKIKVRMKEPGEWSKEARDFCVEQGIFKGNQNGEFAWQDTLTREQAAQIFYNYFNTLHTTN